MAKERKVKEHSLCLTSRLIRILKEYEEYQPHLIDGLHTEVVSNILHWKKQFDAFPPGAERARMSNRMADGYMKEALEENKSFTISCKKGCSGCCHQQVHISPDEADLLAERVRDGVAIDRDKLKRQASFSGDAFAWYAKPRADSSCVFLSDDGECRVYKDRPINCRIHMVITDPIYCQPEGDSSKAGAISNRRVEVFASAMKNLDFGIPGEREKQIRSLPVMLLEKLGAE